MSISDNLKRGTVELLLLTLLREQDLCNAPQTKLWPPQMQWPQLCYCFFPFFRAPFHRVPSVSSGRGGHLLNWFRQDCSLLPSKLPCQPTPNCPITPLPPLLLC